MKALRWQMLSRTWELWKCDLEERGSELIFTDLTKGNDNLFVHKYPWNGDNMRMKLSTIIISTFSE